MNVFTFAGTLEWPSKMKVSTRVGGQSEYDSDPVVVPIQLQDDRRHSKREFAQTPTLHLASPVSFSASRLHTLSLHTTQLCVPSTPSTLSWGLGSPIIGISPGSSLRTPRRRRKNRNIISIAIFSHPSRKSGRDPFASQVQSRFSVWR
jgi:hypothetical protein